MYQKLVQRLLIFTYYAVQRLERKIDTLMSQDTALTAAVSQLTASIQQETTDIQTALQDWQSAQSTPDPVIAAQITALDTLNTNVQNADAQIKAAINPTPTSSGTSGTAPAPTAPASTTAAAADTTGTSSTTVP
jgi:multidrug resistance efflux pump